MPTSVLNLFFLSKNKACNGEFSNAANGKSSVSSKTI